MCSCFYKYFNYIYIFNIKALVICTVWLSLISKRYYYNSTMYFLMIENVFTRGSRWNNETEDYAETNTVLIQLSICKFQRYKRSFE